MDRLLIKKEVNLDLKVDNEHQAVKEEEVVQLLRCQWMTAIINSRCRITGIIEKAVRNNQIIFIQSHKYY